MRASYVLIPAAAGILVLVLLYLRYGPSSYRRKERSAWARLVCAPELSEEEFTSLYARAIEEGLDNAEVTISGPRELTVRIAGRESSYKVWLEKLWQGDAIKVNGEVVAAIPCRDMLIVTGTENLEGIPAIRRAVDEIYENEPYAISRTLLVYRDGRWQPLDPSIDNP